jgi:hypothetical protein
VRREFCRTAAPKMGGPIHERHRKCVVSQMAGRVRSLHGQSCQLCALGPASYSVLSLSEIYLSVFNKSQKGSIRQLPLCCPSPGSCGWLDKLTGGDPSFNRPDNWGTELAVVKSASRSRSKCCHYCC